MSSNHLNEVLQRLGFNSDSVDVLTKVMKNWRLDGEQLTRNRFRNENRSKIKSLDWLLNSEFVRQISGDIYEPQFAAFCVLVAAKKRIATSLIRPMEVVLVRARRLIADDPDRTTIPLKQFVTRFPNQTSVLDSLRLLSSGPYGLYLNGFPAFETATVSFSDAVFGKHQISEQVNICLNDLIRYRSKGPFVGFGGDTVQLHTFSLSSLELVPDALQHAKAAIDKARSEPAAAITSAAACLEAALKWIAHHENLPYSGGTKLSELLNVCREAVALGSNSTHALAKTIANLCHQIPEARNQLSNAHGKGPDAVPPTRQEARFIVGTSVHLAECLLDRWESQRQARSVNS